MGIECALCRGVILLAARNSREAGHDGHTAKFASYGGTHIGHRVIGAGPPLVCLLGGPAVSSRRSSENRKQVGLKATTGGPVPATVMLKRGQTAHGALIIRDAGAICKPVPTIGLSVRPPGKTQASDFGLTAFGACRGKSTMSVDAINPGSASRSSRSAESHADPR